MQFKVQKYQQGSILIKRVISLNILSMSKQFKKVITISRALNSEEKRDLVAVSDALPEEYKKKVGTLLETFDEHSQGRQQFLKTKLEEAYDKLKQELIQDGVEEGKRVEILSKARSQIEKFFSKPYGAQ